MSDQDGDELTRAAQAARVKPMPEVAPLAAGERRVYYSPPVMRTSIILSVMLAVCFFGLWFLLDASIRAQFTWPQVLTLLLFMLVMWAIMLGVGFSRVVATAEGLSVRNWFHHRRFTWDEVEDISFSSGESWPHLVLAPDASDPDGEGDHHMVLGIQRAEGERAFERVREFRALIRAQRNELGLESRSRSR